MRRMHAGTDGAEFDTEVVGPDGRGYCWHAPDAAGAENAPADAARFSLAPPPPLPPPPAEAFPDDDSTAAAGEEGADAAPADPEVGAMVSCMPRVQRGLCMRF